MKLRFPAVLCLFLISSCSEQTESDSGEASAPTVESKEPWEWIPSDPLLVSGREVYMKECSLCHNEGEESSPSLKRKSEWDLRSAKGEETLISHAINGFRGDDGKMPARGGTETLTDDEVASAVRYMLATPK